MWAYSTNDRIAFKRQTRGFSINFAFSFGELLTPLVYDISHRDRCSRPSQKPAYTGRAKQIIVLIRKAISAGLNYH